MTHPEMLPPIGSYVAQHVGIDGSQYDFDPPWSQDRLLASLEDALATMDATNDPLAKSLRRDRGQHQRRSACAARHRSRTFLTDGHPQARCPVGNSARRSCQRLRRLLHDKPSKQRHCPRRLFDMGTVAAIVEYGEPYQIGTDGVRDHAREHQRAAWVFSAGHH
jgi:hypothetical protein